MEKVVRDRGHKKDGLGAVRYEEGQAAGTGVAGKVREAVAKDTEVQIGRK